MAGTELVSKTGEMKQSEKPEAGSFEKIKSEIGTTGDKARAYFDKIFGDDFDKAEFYTSYKERLDHTPVDGERGTYKGERGESMCIPTNETKEGQKVIKKLKEYGLKGIVYRFAVPDFSKCAAETVKIDNMTANRPGNFDAADKKCAEKWNNEKTDGRTDWTQKEVEEYRKDQNLSWHECCDTKTMQLVDQDIHEFFTHSGGVAECKKRDAGSSGGNFDEQK